MRAGGSTLDAPRTGGEKAERESELMRAIPARSGNREVKVGAFVLIGIVAFFVSLFTLTDVGTFRGRYYANTVIENAGGMRNGDPVQMRGVNIGRVSSFGMVPGGVAVRLEIYNRYAVPEDSRAVVRSAGLLGGMVVDIVPGGSTNRIANDGSIPGVVESDILSTATTLGGQAETVLSRVDLLLSENTIGSVGASAAELQVLLEQMSALIQSQRAELDAISQSLRRSAEGVERATAGPELARTVSNIDSITVRLGETGRALGTASESLETVLGRVERGEGTLGRLTVDEALYENLNAAALAIRELVADIQRDPRRYLNVSVF